MGMDLHSFLEAYKGQYIEIKKPVKLDHVGALIAQANDTIVFDQIEGYPGFAWSISSSPPGKPRPGCSGVIRRRS